MTLRLFFLNQLKIDIIIRLLDYIILKNSHIIFKLHHVAHKHVLKANIMSSRPTDLLMKYEHVTTRQKCRDNFRTVALISIHITYISLQWGFDMSHSLE